MGVLQIMWLIQIMSFFSLVMVHYIKKLMLGINYYWLVVVVLLLP